MAATHLYAIIPTGEEVVFDIAGVDNRDTVRAVPSQDFAVVVSASPSEDYRSLNREQIVRYLLAHQRVVETVMRDFPVLPVKFGTVLSDESQVRRFLDQGQDLFLSALEKFARLVQMEVVVFWDIQTIFDRIGEEERIAHLKAKIAGRPAEATTDERIELGRMVQASLEERRGILRSVIVPLLENLALDVVVNPVMDDSMVVNLALLMDESRRGVMDGKLRMLDEIAEGRLQFRCIGPLPPYSFAAVEVRVPSFEEIDAARRQLNLGETTTFSDIKRAYRKLIRRLHPDLNPNDSEAEVRMAELARAYEFLTDYAERQARSAEDGESAVCCFDREKVEETLLIAIRRQESPP